MKKIFWLVGENSGDLHASMVMKRINQDIQNVYHYGVGGSRMQAEKLNPLFEFERFSIMGFVEVLKHICFFIHVENRIKHIFKTDKPDLVILVDYPGLNMRIARIADEARIPVLYFICPQFWAWKHKRVYKLRENVRHVACILPFEKELLDIHNVTSTYVGHPIAEEIKYEMDRTLFASFFGLDPEKKWIGFFPGSRNTELTRMLPIFLETIDRFDSETYEYLFSKTRTVSHRFYLDAIESRKDRVRIIDGYTYEMMKYCDLLIVTSGTATLEAAYIGTPMIIVYKTSKVSYEIGKRLVRVNSIGLPNIILNAKIVPELVQDEVNPLSLFHSADAILNDPIQSSTIREELQKIRTLLGERKASIQVLKIVQELLRNYG